MDRQTECLMDRLTEKFMSRQTNSWPSPRPSPSLRPSLRPSPRPSPSPSPRPRLIFLSAYTLISLKSETDIQIIRQTYIAYELSLSCKKEHALIMSWVYVSRTLQYFRMSFHLLIINHEILERVIQKNFWYTYIWDLKDISDI